MKVVVDTGVLISLGLINQIQLINKVFGDFHIANAVWVEIQKYENPRFDKALLSQIKNHVLEINSNNQLSLLMDYGESESVILYKELNADYLLIEDNKARNIAESLGVNCIGSIGLLLKAKQKKFINEIRPILQFWLENDRYFSRRFVNDILKQAGEQKLKN